MKQRTAKRVVEALYWIHNNEHHIVGTEFHDTKKDETGLPARTHLYLQNYHEKMRIPEALIADVWKLVKANTRKFDSRMYALTTAGKRMIGL